jgi:hypothetical protein
MHPDRRHDRTTVEHALDDDVPTSHRHHGVRAGPAGDGSPTMLPWGGHPE